MRKSEKTSWPFPLSLWQQGAAFVFQGAEGPSLISPGSLRA